MTNVLLPAHQVPVLAECDIVVAGGSCTGVFAAVTAARQGARVALVEAQNRFGGTATAGQVCIWHSFFSSDYSRQIIFGLCQEFVERMQRRHLVDFWDYPNPSRYVSLNTEEMCVELDELVQEAHVTPFLHARITDVWRDSDGALAGLVVATKDGLGVIKGSFFIDATGDADVVRFAGGECWRNDILQTSTACVKFSKWPDELMGKIGRLVHDKAGEYHFPEGFIWGHRSVDSQTYMLAGTNIPLLDGSRQNDLTTIEIEGRRQMRAIADIVAEAGYPRPVIEAVPSLAGIRESVHIRSLHQITVDELLSGCRFPDEAGRGTYRSDIHRRNPPGLIFRYLDGTQVECTPAAPPVHSRWRDESLPTPEYYTWPIRSQIPVGFDNLITAGRMIDADSGAYGALRVMVNMNQSGEAAANAVVKALDRHLTIPQTLPETAR